MNRAEAARILERAEGGSSLDPVASALAPAIEWYLEHDRAAALRLVAALSGYWQDAGRVDEGRALTERVVEATMVEATRERTVADAIPRALLAASELAFRQGDQRAATKRAKDTIRAAILVEDRPTAALAHTALARVAYRDGEAPEIERHARKALKFAADDTAAHSGALHMLAWAAHTAGDLDEAERRFEQSLEYRRQHRGPMAVAVEIGNLGDLAIERGNLRRAAELLAEALQISHASGSAYMLVNFLPSFGILAARAGMDEDAARLFGAGHALASSAGLIPDPNPAIDDASARARDRLGEARFAQLLADGTSLATDEAVALAFAVARRAGEPPS